MRIIAGEFRSRKLLAPRDAGTTRPIPDRVKESLFGLLRGHTPGAEVFDGFAGTGSMGLEAVSRGARRCVMVERDRDALNLLRQNVEMLGVQDRCEVVAGDALGPGALARCPEPATIVFFDPPYALVRDAVGWRRVAAQFQRLIDRLSDDGIGVLRTPWPLVHPIGRPEPAAVPGGSVGVNRGRRRGRREEPAFEEPPEEPRPAAGPVRTAPVGLEFPNARGPETHIYHTMALHLYMRGPGPG